MASKIIVAGALHGRFSEVFPKLAALHAKNNFSFAILLGDVFGASPDSLTIDALLRNEIAVPLPTYFTLGTLSLPSAITDRIENNNGEVCENLFFLGKKGSIKTSEGIRIVAVGGSHDPNLIAATDAKEAQTKYLPFYTAAEVNTLKGVNAADILISNEWPAGVERNSATAPGGRMGGSKPVAELAHQLRPRYHFVPGGEKHWEREPYRNEIRKGESGDRISRFYALGNWGNAGKQKAIFAFSLNITEPTTAAATSTASPYADARGTKRLAEENPNGTFFWGDHTSQHHHKRRGGGRGHQPRPPPGPDSCFFCLSYPQLEKHLIVSIGSESYLTTAKGPLTSAATNPEKLPFSGHILIIPFSHTPTLPLIEDEETRKSTLGEMRRYKLAIEKMLSTRGCGAVTFEIRRRSGVHAHWQFVPIATELLASVDAAFEAAAGEGLGRGFEDEEESEEPGDAFTYWISGAERGRELKLEANEYFDLQFGRRVLAGVLGTGRERGNWRDCVLGVEEESNDAKMFKEAFAEFDFSLEE